VGGGRDTAAAAAAAAAVVVVAVTAATCPTQEIEALPAAAVQRWRPPTSKSTVCARGRNDAPLDAAAAVLPSAWPAAEAALVSRLLRGPVGRRESTSSK